MCACWCPGIGASLHEVGTPPLAQSIIVATWKVVLHHALSLFWYNLEIYQSYSFSQVQHLRERLEAFDPLWVTYGESIFILLLTSVCLHTCA